ncbi:hypothetical protein AVEN_1407-1 [Araneus ventricosus]|uniref:Uncharacterized protein n=1 Tax=Araneus ventricosus TaxID=182803 RepID=A0A4Y2KSJ1_ARAVE|nr:hypothetical protein AVEN_1407-1 [Araneus ventricosus]
MKGRNEEIQMAERKRKEEQEVAERRRQDEIQIAEQKRQEEIELRKLEYEERKRKGKLEYEERKRKDEMKFELQKIRLGAEVKADSFEKLSDLIITDHIKRKVSQEIKDHFIDEWPKLNSPDDLVEKLDDYDTLRSTFRSKQP